jgi:hypothetical protein
LTTSTHLIHQQPLRAVIPIMGICFGKCSKAGHSSSQELNKDTLTTPIWNALV